jgi:hypothetical protein
MTGLVMFVLMPFPLLPSELVSPPCAFSSLPSSLASPPLLVPYQRALQTCCPSCAFPGVLSWMPALQSHLTNPPQALPSCFASSVSSYLLPSQHRSRYRFLTQPRSSCPCCASSSLTKMSPRVCRPLPYAWSVEILRCVLRASSSLLLPSYHPQAVLRTQSSSFPVSASGRSATPGRVLCLPASALRPRSFRLVCRKCQTAWPGRTYRHCFFLFARRGLHCLLAALHGCGRHLRRYSVQSGSHFPLQDTVLVASLIWPRACGRSCLSISPRPCYSGRPRFCCAWS